MASLILSVSPEKVERPYYFYMTKIKVYSLEELYYHCYHYWKQSIDDFLMGKLEDWIKLELGLNSISSQIAKIKDEFPSITDQYVRFLDIIDYFYESELDTLRKEIFKWENKAEWEKCKEKADYFMAQNKPEEALKWYKKAIVYDENAKLYNNMGVACIHMGWYEDASYFLNKAYEKDSNSVSILLNLTEVYLLKGNYDQGAKYLKQAAKLEDSKTICFYFGELYRQQGSETEAIEFYKRAIQKGDKFDSYIRLSRLYLRRREYETAEDYLEQIPNSFRNEVYWMEYANLYESWNKEDLALDCIQKSIEKNKKYILAWVSLARLYRKKRKLDEAAKAIDEALKVNEEDEGAKLEKARIQKEEGKQEEYQFSIREIIKKWIHRFRQDSV
jgi:tetratricopeptide (TPR) repeat protein